MKYRIWIVGAVAIILTILAPGCGNHPAQTTSLAVTDFNGVKSASSKSANGLSLSLSLDAKTYKPGDTINIVVSESNILPKTNKILASDKWPINGLSVDICGTRSFPFGVVIVRGDYTTGNISAATPLILYNPNGIVQCYIPPVLNVAAYNFQPSSDTATLTSSTTNQTVTLEMSAEVPAWSYWAGSSPNAVQQNFEPGIHTVVAGDEWGALVVLHFTVSQ